MMLDKSLVGLHVCQTDKWHCGSTTHEKVQVDLAHGFWLSTFFIPWTPKSCPN